MRRFTAVKKQLWKRGIHIFNSDPNDSIIDLGMVEGKNYYIKVPSHGGVQFWTLNPRRLLLFNDSSVDSFCDRVVKALKP